jgi:plastocyanin
MRHVTMLLMTSMLAASLLAGCNDDNAPTAPTNAPPSTPPPSTPPPSTPPPSTPPPSTPPPSTPAPTTAAVTVGDIFFKSDLNGSSNPAVDTVAVNGTVTWTWATSEALPHSVQSTGSPSFASSGILTGSGNTYAFTFTAPGTYQYDCAVHGQMMTGTIVVVAADTSASTPPVSTPAPAAPPPSTPAPAAPPAGY